MDIKNQINAIRERTVKASAGLQHAAANRFTFPILLAFLTLISFGLLIPFMGFYWDDWPFIWLSHIVTPYQLTFLEVQRPLTGWLFALVRPLLLDYPVRWQLFNLSIRWLLGCAMLWALLQVWPGHTEEATWAALIFLLYPGFNQQNVSVNSSRQMLPLAALIISFGFTALACRAPNRRRLVIFSIVSTVLSTTSMLTTDYYLSLEILRPLLIWLILSGASSRLNRLKTTLLNWLPNLAPGFLVLIWRFFVTKQLYYPISIPHQIFLNAASLFDLLLKGLHDLADAAGLVWFRVFNPVSTVDIGARSIWIFWAVAAGTGLTLLVYLAALHLAQRQKLAQSGAETAGHQPGSTWWKSALLIGAIGLVAGALPDWSIGSGTNPGFPQDRLYLPMMIGATLLLTGVLRAIPYRAAAIGILAVILGLAAGHHFENATAYRWDWGRQKAFFWQLAWRIPGLEPGTTLLTDDLSFDFETDNSITAPVNWMYAPDNTSDQMSYIVFDVKVRPWLDPTITNKNNQITRVYREFAKYRTFSFSGSLSKVLVVYQNYPACLRVIQPYYDQYSDDYSPAVGEAFALSDPDLILPSPKQPARPPEEIFGPQPGKDWCYYYEKADLARQFGNWNEVATLGAAAIKKYSSSSPAHASEYVLFIEGFGRQKNYQEAEKLTYLTIQQDKNLDRMLCSTWDGIEAAATPSDSEAATIQRVRATLSCKSN